MICYRLHSIKCKITYLGINIFECQINRYPKTLIKLIILSNRLNYTNCEFVEYLV